MKQKALKWLDQKLFLLLTSKSWAPYRKIQFMNMINRQTVWAARPIRRKTLPTTKLIRSAVGPRETWRGRFERFQDVLGNIFLRPHIARARIQRAKDLEISTTTPELRQIWSLGLVMLVRRIGPDYRSFCEQEGIDYNFQNYLRFIMEPASLVDPTAMYSNPTTLMHHVLQQVHLEAIFDFQALLVMGQEFEHVRAFRDVVAAILEDRHPHAGHLMTVVENNMYYFDLLDQIDEYLETEGHPKPRVREGAKEYLNAKGEPIGRRLDGLGGFLDMASEDVPQSWLGIANYLWTEFTDEARVRMKRLWAA